ncbi:MAG TPA: thioesterase family protein [Actinomycetaceae bacterium]|nr:thioesterase family protein [Actinomycetaceae bacterium]
MKTTVNVSVRWSDLDAYRHVNNVAIAQLLEEARVALFWHNDGSPSGGADSAESSAARDIASFVVRQEIEYLRPLGYPRGPLPITIWVSHIGSSSLDVCYEVPTLDGGIAAKATTVVTMVDIDTGRPRRLRDDERAGLMELLDEPLKFRRRETPAG